ncbi:MAG: hypothetical protein ACM336_21730 [Acidobacteriota bacterium]
MISELLIVALIVVLGTYWFRYNCKSILKSKVHSGRAEQVASANQLTFHVAGERLRGEISAGELDGMNRGLLRDYKVLRCLLRYTVATSYTVEQRILMLDFRYMQLRYALTRRYFNRSARRALGECVAILNHFANTLGERSAGVMRV